MSICVHFEAQMSICVQFVALLSIFVHFVVFSVYMLIRARVKIGFMFRVHFWTSLVFDMLDFCVRIGLTIGFMFAAL